MRTDDMGDELVADLSEEECWQLLAQGEMGRLALSVGGVPDIFPVNHNVDGRSLLLRTAEGAKLFELTMNSCVAFEVDGWNADYAWSVVLRGTAAVIEREIEQFAALRLGVIPWTPLPTTVFVRISPLALTGRRMQRGGFDRWA